MTTDKTPATLATVKHGGCVQLGSEERVRFDAWLETISVDTTRWGDGEYTDPYAANYWLAWQAAPSAQSSPGGQGALADAARRVISDIDSGDYHGEISEATYAALEEALAARQPVGNEPAFYLSAGAWGHIRVPMTPTRDVKAFRHGFDHGDTELVPFYAAPPVQQPAQVYLDGLDRALGEAIDQRDRYHEMADELAAHIASITGVDIGEHSSANCPWQNAIEAAEEYKPAQAVDLGQTFQAGVAEWMGQCFLPSLYSNMTERGDRLLEEVLELLQAHGYDKTRVATLVDYVFGRPVGEPAQEVGGVMVTLAGYCWVAGLDMHANGQAELDRINQPDVMAKIQAKQEAKNALHFDTPLPGHAAPTAQTVDLGAERMFYIQDTRQFVGNCPMWWGPNGSGYVTRLDEAGRYTEQEAIKQNRTRDTDIPWPCAEIDAIARRTVDGQHMRPRAERLAELALVDSQAVGNG